MTTGGPPDALSRGFGVLMATMLAAGCGVPPGPAAFDESVPELTFVGLEQFSTPAPVTQPGEPTFYRVSVDVTLVFRFADKLETLIVQIDGPSSGRRVDNEFDLGVLAPDIADETQGRHKVRVPLSIPELGSLPFSALVIDRNGNRSHAVEGSFTVESALGANDTTQTQTTGVGTTAVVEGL